MEAHALFWGGTARFISLPSVSWDGDSDVAGCNWCLLLFLKPCYPDASTHRIQAFRWAGCTWLFLFMFKCTLVFKWKAQKMERSQPVNHRKCTSWIACIPQRPQSMIILLSKLNLHSGGRAGWPEGYELSDLLYLLRAQILFFAEEMHCLRYSIRLSWLMAKTWNLGIHEDNVHTLHNLVRGGGGGGESIQFGEKSKKDFA